MFSSFEEEMVKIFGLENCTEITFSLKVGEHPSVTATLLMTDKQQQEITKVLRKYKVTMEEIPVPPPTTRRRVLI